MGLAKFGPLGLGCPVDLHERSAKEGNDDHGQPAWHLGESPHDVCKRNVDTGLLQPAVKGVESAFVWRGFLILVLCMQLRDFQCRHAGSVKRDVSNRGGRLRLARQRLWKEEMVNGWRAKRPHATQNLFSVAINSAQMGWVR